MDLPFSFEAHFPSLPHCTFCQTSCSLSEVNLPVQTPSTLPERPTRIRVGEALATVAWFGYCFTSSTDTSSCSRYFEPSLIGCGKTAMSRVFVGLDLFCAKRR